MLTVFPVLVAPAKPVLPTVRTLQPRAEDVRTHLSDIDLCGGNP
jgi:hypothetical protein